jgi:hypothetical protein
MIDPFSVAVSFFWHRAPELNLEEMVCVFPAGR